MRLSLRAWRGDHYVSLEELLRVIGDQLVGCRWNVHVEEVAPEPGAAALEAIDSSRDMDLDELIRVASPSIQLIDGLVVAKRNNDSEPSLLLRAVDSTSWDIETQLCGVLNEIRRVYPEAVEIPEE